MSFYCGIAGSSEGTTTLTHLSTNLSLHNPTLALTLTLPHPHHHHPHPSYHNQTLSILFLIALLIDFFCFVIVVLCCRSPFHLSDPFASWPGRCVISVQHYYFPSSNRRTTTPTKSPPPPPPPRRLIPQQLRRSQFNFDVTA